MIDHVMLDLDDVCNEFSMAAFMYAGATEVQRSYNEYPKNCGWDIVKAANRLSGKGFTPNTFWGSLDRRFWATIPPTRYLELLINFLEEQVGQENITIATSATISPECVAGKLEWIHTYLPRWLHRQYMIGTQKELLARPGTLLIDDRKSNCDKFRANNGSALLVLRPWNFNTCVEVSTLASLNKGLYYAFGRVAHLC